MDIANCILVGLNYAGYTVAFGIEDITIHSETVINVRLIWWDYSAVSKARDQLVTIVVL